LLSTDETDELLQAMRNGAPKGGSAKEGELGSADERMRKSLGKADDVARDWAGEVRKVLRRMLGVSASVREMTTDIVPYSVSQQAVPPGAAVCVLRGPDSAVCFLVMGPGLTSFVLNRRLGGAVPSQDSQNTQSEDVRQFLSPLDRRIVRPFCEEVISAFVTLWGAEDISLKVIEVLGKPVDMPRLGQFEPLLRMPLSVSFGMDSNEELSILLGGAAVRPPKPEEPPPEPEVASGDKSRMVARLSFVELELVAVLGKSPSTVRNVLSMSVGDVLRLDEAPTSPLQIFVEGQKKMIGVPVVSHGNIAVEITQVLKGVP
ncbi:MAG: Flagellar motor switch protein FliM, partial [Myxococcaceae bacterium]|nr:Flagellar motor switch protein FliM [Myxococcaceae bacterium]